MIHLQFGKRNQITLMNLNQNQVNQNMIHLLVAGKNLITRANQEIILKTVKKKESVIQNKSNE